MIKKMTLAVLFTALIPFYGCQAQTMAETKPVSAEVTAMDYETMMKEAEVLRKIARNVTIKVPLTQDGLKVCRALSSEGTMVNVTLCFTCGQAILAAKAGATFVSPSITCHEHDKWRDVNERKPMQEDSV